MEQVKAEQEAEQINVDVAEAMKKAKKSLDQLCEIRARVKLEQQITKSEEEEED